MKKFLVLFCLIPAILGAQNIPKIGNDTLLDIGAWNIEWFGDTGYGPTNEALQYSNVKAVITKTDMDIWAFEEMSNPTSFAALTSDLPNYGSVNSTFSQTQKMCLFYKKSMFTLINSEHILSSSNYDFASRQPLMVTLATKGDSLKTDTMYFIVVHLKANSDNTATAKLESYNRRKRAADALKAYIESNLLNKKYFIMGDWNDRLDFSIHNGKDTTPFKQLLDANYNFITKPLADAGKRSYAFSDGFIDHILIAPKMDSFYVKQSAGVMDNLGQFIPSYSNNTSDHYPVFGRFLFNKKTYAIPVDTIPKDTVVKDTTTNNIHHLSEINTVNIFPNPTSGIFDIVTPNFLKNSPIEIYNQIGQLMQTTYLNSNATTIDLSQFENGIYLIKVQNFHYKILKK